MEKLTIPTRIEVGQIWEVIDNEFWSSENENHRLKEDGKNRNMKVNYLKGEFIEIRYLLRGILEIKKIFMTTQKQLKFINIAGFTELSTSKQDFQIS